MAEKENQKTNDDTPKSKQHNLWKKIILKTITVLFVWLPASIISLLLLVLLTLKLYLSPERTEKLIISSFNNISYGTIDLKIKDFSPYSGFEINNIIIKNGEEFGKTKFVEIEKLVLHYGLFSMLIGNIHFDEIGIYKPRIYLKERNGVWNAAKLMKPGEKKPEEKEKEEPAGEPLNEINLPVSIEFLFKFILDDLRVYVDGSSFDSSVEGLTYKMDIWVPPFKHVPMSPDAVKILERMKIELNPQGDIDVAFASKIAEAKTPLTFTWKLAFSRDKDASNFDSFFKFGTYKAPVRFKGVHLAPLNFYVSYDMKYNPASDHLKLSSLGVQFKEKTWLNLSGEIKQVTKSQQIDISMTESRIVLDDLFPYFVSVTGDRQTKFGGSISLYPLTVKGTPSNLAINGALNLKDIVFKNPSAAANMPSFNLAYSANKINEDMKFILGLNIPHLSFAFNGEKSGDNGVTLNLDANSYNNFSNITVNSLEVKYFNPVTAKAALDMALDANVKLKPEMSGNLKITKFTFLKEPLSVMLTRSLVKSVSSIPLKKPFNMDMNLDFALGEEITKADLAILMKVPDFNVNDLKIAVNVVQDNTHKKVQLNKADINSKSLGLFIDAHGNINISEPPFADSDLKLSVKLDSPKMKQIYADWKLSGLVQLAAAMKGDLKTGSASGSIKIADFNVKNDVSSMSVEDVNMNFPFMYSFASSGPGASRIAVDKAFVIDNENFKEKENFTIKSIKAMHPARKEIIEYLKDFAATMFFRNNAFEIEKLKCYVLDGAVYGRNILFNLADMPSTGSFKNVEYRFILDVTNVDMGRLDESAGKKTRDAEISLNANFTGHGLDMFAGKGKDRSKEFNIKGYININKVGENIANKLFKGLSEEKGESKLGFVQYAVDNSMSIKGFNYIMGIGLVYVKVKFEKRTIGLLLSVEDVIFDRIPIQDYLNNIIGKKEI